MKRTAMGSRCDCNWWLTKTILISWLMISGVTTLPATAQNTAVAWGAGTKINKADGNDFGQSIVPPGLTNAALIAGGWRHSLALRSNGTTLLGWGDDSLGQTNFFPAGGSNYLTIGCGYLHSVALQTNGVIATAGDDFYGQTDVPSTLTNAVAVACGFYHNLALKADGKVSAWGANTVPQGTAPNYGQSAVPAGVSNVVALSAGAYHSLALRDDGTLVAWGWNASGQTNIPAGLSNIVAIAAGGFHNLALRSNGTLMAWGLNNYGQTDIPSGTSNVVAIAAGGWHSLALKRDGTVVAWGAGIGSDTNVDYGQNVVPGNLTNVIQIAAGTLNSLALVSTNPPPQTAQWSGISFKTNGFTASLPTRNGKVYRLEYKSSLTSSAWTGFGLYAGNGRITVFRDPAPESTNRYYRVTVW